MPKEYEKIQIDVAVMKEQLDNLCERLEKIEKNDLIHIHEELTNIKIKQAYYAGGIIASFTTIQFIFNYFIK